MAKTLHAEADLLHGPVLQNMLRFALPILAGTLLQQLYSMVDAVVVGQFVGKTALAAVGGSAVAIINLLLNFFVGLCSGAAIVVAQDVYKRQAPSAPGPQPFQLHIADRRAEQQRIQSCQHERDHARTPGRDVLALPCSKCRKRQQDQPDGNRILRLRERAVRALRQPRQRE